MRSIKIPGRYKHFKGEIYITLEILNPIKCEEEKIMPEELFAEHTFFAEHTECGMAIPIVKRDKKYFYEKRMYDPIKGKYNFSKEKAVFYLCLTGKNKGKYYIRPLEMFKSKVDKEKYPSVRQEYRFEETGIKRY